MFHAFILGKIIKQFIMVDVFLKIHQFHFLKMKTAR